MSSERQHYYLKVMGYITFKVTRSAPLAVRRSFFLDVEMSICCHRTDSSVLTVLFAVLGWPIECQTRGEEVVVLWGQHV